MTRSSSIRSKIGQKRKAKRKRLGVAERGDVQRALLRMLDEQSVELAKLRTDLEEKIAAYLGKPSLKPRNVERDSEPWHDETSARQSHRERLMPHEWKANLSSYNKLVALKFRTRRDFEGAVDRIFSAELRGMPVDPLGGHAIAVPEEAVPFFSGLDFEQQEIVSGDDLPMKKLVALRRERDHLWVEPQ